MHSQEKVDSSLKLYHQCRSATKTVQTLGYPTRKALYGWIHAEGKPKKQREVLDPINTKTHPRNPPVEVKMDALHRCFELGESIKSVSEDIGYTRASIYALLLEKLNLAKSCYYYQENVLSKPDKYTKLCKRIREMFKGNKGRYGYRRIHGLLAKEVCTVSEKVVRRIMKQENLVVKIRKERKYSSYKGKILPVNNNEHPIIIYVILATVHEMILDLK